MIKYLFRLAVFIALIGLHHSASAAANTQSLRAEYLEKARQNHLAANASWLALLHTQSSLFQQLKGQAKSSRFYLATDGRTNPSAELEATIAALFSEQENENHALCRFPARAHWLIQQLAIAPDHLPHPNCEALKHYLSEINPEGVTLVFPIAYLNSPSSMFGHTFLRIDQIGQTETTRLVAWSVNYAANPNTKDGEVVFAWKGLFGGYPGVFSVLPYYLKVQEYNDWESRDVWEFKLNLTQTETEQLVRHVWELMNIEFDYYFLTKNCSYQVLELLDTVRPQNQLAAQFNNWAIPVDTVRAVEDAKMVEGELFRPSAMKLVRNGLNQLSREEQNLANKLATAQDNEFAVAAKQITQLEPTRQSAVLEVAYEYLRLKVQLDKLSRASSAQRSLWLLKTRSQIANASPLAPVPAPDTRDDQAHESSRLSISLGKARSYAFQDINWRPAFHALTDPYPGFPTGAQIKFLDTHFRNWANNSPDSAELERIDLITVTALTQYDQFFQPWSWQVNTGVRRQETKEDSVARPMVGFFDFSGGINKSFNDSISAYALFGASTEFAKTVPHGFDLGPLLEIGLFGHYSAEILPYAGQWQVSAKRIEWVKLGRDTQQYVEINNSFNLERNLALQLKFARDKRQEHWSSEFSVGVAWFF